MSATIKIPANLLSEMQLYANAVKVEIGGVIIGSKTGVGEYTATSIMVLPQLVTSVEVEIEDAAIAANVRTLYRQFNKDAKQYLQDKHTLDMCTLVETYMHLSNKRLNVIGQWHSHVNMSVTPSGRDEMTLTDLAKEYGVMAMLIINKEGARSVHFAAYGDIVVKKVVGELEVIPAIGEVPSITTIVDTIKANLFHSYDYGMINGKITKREVPDGDESRLTV